jgi:guanylate kinase
MIKFENKIFVLTGMPLSGKTSIMTALLQDEKYKVEGLTKMIAATTRIPRPGEVDGKDYWFMTKDEFDAERNGGNMLVKTFYTGDFYGILRSDVIKAKVAGTDIITTLDMYSTEQLEGIFGVSKVVSIFIYRDMMDIYHDLRQMELPKEQSDRIYRKARSEFQNMDKCDFLIYNTADLSKAIYEVRDIIMDDKKKRFFMSEFQKNRKALKEGVRNRKMAKIY